MAPVGKDAMSGGGRKRVSDLFYWAVIQAVLLFRSESWAMLVIMMRMVESTHMGLLFQITGKQEIQHSDGSC